MSPELVTELSSTHAASSVQTVIAGSHWCLRLAREQDRPGKFGWVAKPCEGGGGGHSDDDGGDPAVITFRMRFSPALPRLTVTFLTTYADAGAAEIFIDRAAAPATATATATATAAVEAGAADVGAPAVTLGRLQDHPPDRPGRPALGATTPCGSIDAFRPESRYSQVGRGGRQPGSWAHAAVQVQARDPRVQSWWCLICVSEAAQTRFTARFAKVDTHL